MRERDRKILFACGTLIIIMVLSLAGGVANANTMPMRPFMGVVALCFVGLGFLGYLSRS